MWIYKTRQSSTTLSGGRSTKKATKTASSKHKQEPYILDEPTTETYSPACNNR